jgi:SPOR domain
MKSPYPLFASSLRHAPLRQALVSSSGRGAQRTFVFSLLLSPVSCLLFFLTFPSLASAQLWTIQAAAFRDYRDATAAVDQLKTQGFDAYSEFAMSSDNQQYARVRVGCFDTKETATLTAQRLVGTFTKEAEPVILTQGAPVTTCLYRSIGFITPSTWYVYMTLPEVAVLMVDFQGRQAFIKHDGTSWQLGQNLTDLGLVGGNSVTTNGYFSESPASPYPQILYSSGTILFITQGRLLWQKGDVAVVAEGNAVVAYQIVRP